MSLIGSIDFVKKTEPQSFGERVRALRKLRGMSQVALAKKAGIKQSSLSDIETGETTADNVKAPTMMGLAKALETNPGFLRSGQETPVKPETLSPEEAELIAVYRELGKVENGLQGRLLERARGMLDIAAPHKTTRAKPFRTVRVPEKV
jgi:transcriptional regulator with XRE-family HTH domain